MDVLLEGVEVEQGQDLIPSVVGPVGSEDLLLDGTSISEIEKKFIFCLFSKYSFSKWRYKP